MTTQHTPGPWISKELHANYSGNVVLRDTGSGLKRIDDKGGAFSEPDARLIAVAPDMFRLLNQIQDEFSAGRRLGMEPGSAFALNVRDVIAKAEGK